MNRIVCGVPRPIFALSGTWKARRIRSIGLNRREGRPLWGLNGVVVPSAAGLAGADKQNEQKTRGIAVGTRNLMHRRKSLLVVLAQFEGLSIGNQRRPAMQCIVARCHCQYADWAHDVS